MDAVSDVVTIPASDATETTIKKSADTFNVNQSNNNTHTQPNAHTVSNSLLNKTTSNIISNSLNIGGSSNSSDSSGYGSATTTPTNNYDLQNTTPATTPIPSTPVAHTEHVIPVATVAAVTPFYNEAITVHNLETQHHHHSHQAQQSQIQQQLQQHQHQVLPTHHQQYTQNHMQTNIQQQQQHHQYLPRQQYYSPYDYQQPAPIHNLSAASDATAVAPYNMLIPGPYEMSSSTVNPLYGGSQYKATNATVNSTYERSPLVKPNVATTSYTEQSQHHLVEQPQQLQQPKAINQHFTSILSSNKPRSSSSLIGTAGGTNTSKPQATATPFYANPTPFYDNYKHKIPLEYHDIYSNSSPATAATYHQQQKYYAAAKSQLKEASYGSAAGLSSKSAYANTSNIFPGSTAGLNLSSASYDKYMYSPHAPPTGFTATAHLGNETPTDISNYRKPIMGSNMNSPSWPWGIEYASGNSRSIPPPASHLPTATVAPTHATHLTQNPSVLARDPFYMTHDKYVGKYDKFNTSSYPQTYVSPPTNRHMWSNTPHVSNMTAINDRHLVTSGPAALPTHGLHTNHYYPNNPNAGLNNRQTCCTQPYQPQNCYYPVSHPAPQRLPQNSTVSPSTTGYLTAQQSLGQSPHLNALAGSCKYTGVLPDYGNVNKIKTSNDLYLNPHHYDSNPPMHNFGYATAHNNQQLYNSNAHHSAVHGTTPSPLLTNDSLNTNPTSYTNDLNLTTSNFDNYHTHLDNLSNQQNFTGIHNTQTMPAYGPTGAKRALLDYRKPIQPQPPPTINEDYYPSLSSREHFNQHELLNTPETTTTFEEYEVHQINATDLTTEVLSNSEAVIEESTKNLSLRDFIANWNDDEDEYQNTEDLSFDESAVINEVLQAAPVEKVPSVEMIAIQEVKIIKPAPQNVKANESPKETAETDKDQNKVLSVTEAKVYTNLPDIVIDIKKSNNNNNSTTTPASPPLTSSIQAEVTKDALNLSDFDVEKELDELNLRKPQQQELTKEINDIKELKCTDSPHLISSKSLSFEDLNFESTNKTVPSAITPRLTTVAQGSELNEQYLKDIEGYESSCSRHSNESAFEKEYETFINKITSETTGSIKPGEQKTLEAEKETDFDKKVQDFSKFYKRKRKLKEDEQKANTTANQIKKKLKTNDTTKVNNSNFPQAYTKKCRMRLPANRKGKSSKHKPVSAFYKIIYSLRHRVLQRGKRVREFLLEMKEKHLPLIKRQSIKNYTPATSENLFNPQTLKAMCIMVFNTEEFHLLLAMEKEQTQLSSLIAEPEKKHICDDPACDTCDVIKSLMDTETFEATLMQQITPLSPRQQYCTEVIQEPILILEDITNTKDIQFLKEDEAIIISNDIANNPENLSILSENCILEGKPNSFLITDAGNEPANVPAVITLQSTCDDLTALNLETDFSETEKVKPCCQDFELQSIDPVLAYTDDVPIEEHLKPSYNKSVIHENFESKNSQDKSTLYVDLNKDVLLATKENFQVRNVNVDEKSVKILTSNENSLPQNIQSAPLHNKKCDKTNNSEESDSDDSDSSESESDHSSSDTENSDRNGSSSSESSATDTENDLDEDKTKSSNSKRNRNEEIKPANNLEFSAQTHTISNNKTKVENENGSNSAQRIVIRITKSLSPNEQSLRVENISGKSLKTQNDHDQKVESDVESQEENIIVKQKENYLEENLSKEQPKSPAAETCNKEKKLVTPLKLVLRGKEYLRVKNIKKSLKLQTKNESNTESETESESGSESESENMAKRGLVTSKVPVHEEEKSIKRGKLKDNEVHESSFDKLKPSQGTEHLKEPLEDFNKPEQFQNDPKNFEATIREEKIISDEVTIICETKNNNQPKITEEKEFIKSLTSPKSCLSSIILNEQETSDLKNTSYNKTLEKYTEEKVSESYLETHCTKNSSSEISDKSTLPVNNDLILEEFNQHKNNLSPKYLPCNEKSFESDILHDIEIENAASFAILSENRDCYAITNMVKTSSLEIIETYSLTDSDDEEKPRSEADIQCLTDSDDNCFEYDTDNDDYDDDESITNFSSSIKTIVISDDDSLDNSFDAGNCNKRLKSTDQETCHQRLKKFFIKTSRTDFVKSKPDSLKTSAEVKKNEAALDNFFNSLKNHGKEICESDQDISDCSYSTTEESDEEEIVVRSYPLKTQELNLVIPTTFARFSTIGDDDESDAEISTDSTVKQAGKILNLEEEKGNDLIIFKQTETAKEAGKDDSFVNQSCESQKELVKDKDLIIYERKQSLEKTVKDDLREDRLTPTELVIKENNKSSTPNILSLATERQNNLTHAEIRPISPLLSLKENSLEATTKMSQSERELSHISSFENISQDIVSERSLIPEESENDNESISSTSCTSISSSQIICEERSRGKINFCTKTKAAYKCFDMEDDLQEETLSDSESENLCSNPKTVLEALQTIDTGDNLKLKSKSTDYTDHIISADSTSSWEDKSLQLLEEVNSPETQSEPGEMPDKIIDSDQFNKSEYIESPIFPCSPAKEILNDLEEIQSDKTHIGEIATKESTLLTEESKIIRSTLQTGINTNDNSKSLDSIKDKVWIPEQSDLLAKETLMKEENIIQTAIKVIKNDVNELEINEATCKSSSMLTKELSSEDEIQENGKISDTENNLNPDNLLDLIENPITSTELVQQPRNELNENLENKIPTTFAECDRSENFENAESPELASVSPEKRSVFEVIEKDLPEKEETVHIETIACNTTEHHEATTKEHCEEPCPPYENLDKTMETNTKFAIEESVISDSVEVLENQTECCDNNVDSSDKSEGNTLTQKHQNLQPKLCETQESDKESKEENSDEIPISSNELSPIPEVKCVSENTGNRISEEMTMMVGIEQGTESKYSNFENDLIASTEECNEADVIEENSPIVSREECNEVDVIQENCLIASTEECNEADVIEENSLIASTEDCNEADVIEENSPIVSTEECNEADVIEENSPIVSTEECNEANVIEENSLIARNEECNEADVIEENSLIASTEECNEADVIGENSLISNTEECNEADVSEENNLLVSREECNEVDVTEENSLLASTETCNAADIIKQKEETDLKDISLSCTELDEADEIAQSSKDANKDDKTEEVVEGNECVSDALESSEEKDLKQSSLSDNKLETISEERYLKNERNEEEITEESLKINRRSDENEISIDEYSTKEITEIECCEVSIEEEKDESAMTRTEEEHHECDLEETQILANNSDLTPKTENQQKEICSEESLKKIKDLCEEKLVNKVEERTFDDRVISCNNLDLLNEKQPIQKGIGSEVIDEEKICEPKVVSTDETPERETQNKPTNKLDLIAEIKHISNEDNMEKICNEFKEEDEDMSKTAKFIKETKESSSEKSLTSACDLDSLPAAQQLSKDATRKESNDENMGEEQSIPTVLNIETRDKNRNEERNSILNKEFHSSSTDINKKIQYKETIEEEQVLPNFPNDLNSLKENKQNKLQLLESDSETSKEEQFFIDSNKKVLEEQKLENFAQIDTLNNEQSKASLLNDEELFDQIEEKESLEKNIENNEIVMPEEHQAAEVLVRETQLEMSNESESINSINKSCITPDELSADFFGFKHQASFEDESEDFHGFEDLEEVTRIRQEIENINDDSVANDGFLNNLHLKGSTISLTDSTISEINELEALEKELSRHPLDEEITEDDKDNEKDCSTKTIKVVSTNDIEHIKQMLESDEELQNDNENKLEIITTTSKDKWLESKNTNNINACLDSVISKIPKLSDLCRAALNSSLNSSSNLAQKHTETSTILVERELSVEEALAEMYRQAGVLLSEPEDCDNDEPPSGDTEAHDVLLINLQEILNSDNNDVYVLQCDMNDNVLNVVQSNEQQLEEERLENVEERVNTVQIILDTESTEPQIHIISSDSESEVVILSDDDDESEFSFKTFGVQEDHVTIPFINDEVFNNGEDNLFDISTIHHEEIVPDNLAKFLREEFYKYLHEKYVQRNISKYYHANRVLKKYKRRFIRKQQHFF